MKSTTYFKGYPHYFYGNSLIYCWLNGFDECAEHVAIARRQALVAAKSKEASEFFGQVQC